MWTEIQKLTAPDAAANDRFGIGVSLDGDVLAFGADFNDEAWTNAGAIYVFGPDCFFGPEDQPLVFERVAGKPEWATVEWESCGGTGTLHITSTRVASAFIYLNGELLIGPSVFTNHDVDLSLAIELMSGTNTLEVKLAGKPGGVLQMEFTGD